MRRAFVETTVNGVKLIQWTGPGLEGVTAVFSTRLGGAGSGPFAQLNLSSAVGDEDHVVKENRRRFLQAAGILDSAGGAGPVEVIGTRQVHGNDVLVADPAAVTGSCDDFPGIFMGRLGPGDGLVTDRPGRFLATFHADCTPVFLVDPVARVVSLVHAGWRGTLARIAARAVEAACRLGARPGRMLAGIGPAIGPCCYEVDGPVIDAAQESLGRDADRVLLPHRPGRRRLNLWEANRLVLVQAGVDPRNINVAGLCTCCRPDLFFSYRRDYGRPSGRMAALLGMKAG